MGVFREAIYGLSFDDERKEGSIERREEIVRCRDCEHYMSGSRCNLQDDCNEFHWLDVEPDGFCAWASRKVVGE